MAMFNSKLLVWQRVLTAWCQVLRLRRLERLGRFEQPPSNILWPGPVAQLRWAPGPKPGVETMGLIWFNQENWGVKQHIYIWYIVGISWEHIYIYIDIDICGYHENHHSILCCHHFATSSNKCPFFLAERPSCTQPGDQVHRPEDVVEDFRHPLLSQKLERHQLLSRSKKTPGAWQ